MEPFGDEDVAAVDPLDFRRVMGRFATGVTVVTAYDGTRHLGMTANSFTSVSLDPVLVLVSVEKIARFHDAVLAAGGFAVNILAADQQDVSRNYAARGTPKDPTAETAHRLGSRTGAVVLTEALATMECDTWAVYDGGDHSLVIGEVTGLDLHRPDAAPLVFYDGGYHALGVRVEDSRS